MEEAACYRSARDLEHSVVHLRRLEGEDKEEEEKVAHTNTQTHTHTYKHTHYLMPDYGKTKIRNMRA